MMRHLQNACVQVGFELQNFALLRKSNIPCIQETLHIITNMHNKACAVIASFP